MNEYIVVDFKIQSSHVEKKRWKMTTKNGHPCTKWFSSLCLQTNCKYMSNNHWSVCGKHHFIRKNTNTHDNCICDQLIANVCLVVHQMCCNLLLKTEHLKNDSIALESPETLRAFWSMHLHYPAILLSFQWSFAWSLKNISPTIWYISPPPLFNKRN